MSLSIVSLNARGLRDNLKRKALFLFAKQCKTDFCFFQETHTVNDDVHFWRSQWGNEAFFSHASQRSAGVCTLKNKFTGGILHTDCDKNGHYTCQVFDTHNINLIIINIYGYNTLSDNNNLLINVEKRICYWMARFPNAYLIIGGDFNVTLDNTIDRWPPGNQTSTSVKLKMLMQQFDLIDAWREKCPNDRIFTWCNKTRSRQSRIDFWLILSNLKDYVNVGILSTPLTDHKAIQIHISLLSHTTNCPQKSYWKLNSSVLCHEAFILRVKELIQILWNEAQAEGVYGSKWELLKFEVGKFFRKYCSNLVKNKRYEEEQVISKITALSSICPDNLSSEEKETLFEYQNKLDRLYQSKAKGAFVRSRWQWLEEGEQNSAYFF